MDISGDGGGLSPPPPSSPQHSDSAVGLDLAWAPNSDGVQLSV